MSTSGGPNPYSVETASIIVNDQVPREEDKKSSQFEDEPRSEDSSPDPNRALQEMTSNREDKRITTADSETDYDPHKQSLGEQDKSLTEAEYNAQDLDRENANLKAALADLTEDNNRQRMELQDQEEELRRIRAAFRNELQKNSTFEWLVERAEESNQRLEKEKADQGDMLLACLNERRDLEEEITARDEALKDFQKGLEMTESLMDQQAEMIESYRKERESWEDVSAHSKSEENQLLRMRLCKARNMGSASEDMCQSVASQLAVNLVNLTIFRESCEDKKRAKASSLVFGPDGQLGHAAQSQNAFEDQTMIDVGYPSPDMAMSIDFESDKDDPMEIDSNCGVQNTATSYEHTVDEHHQHVSRNRSDTPPNDQIPNIPEEVPGTLHQKESDPFYSPQMNWEETQAQYLNAASSETSSEDGKSMITQARKRRRCNISTTDTTLIVDEGNIELPNKQIRICRLCGMIDQDSMGDDSACTASDSGSDSSKSTIMGLKESCPTHRELFEPREFISVGVQTEQGTDGHMEDHQPPGAKALLVESIGVQTDDQTSKLTESEVQTKSYQGKMTETGVQTDRSGTMSKEVQTTAIDTSSTSTQTDPTYVWTPVNGTLPKPQRCRKSLGQENASTTGKVQLKRLGRASSMPHPLATPRRRHDAGKRMQGCVVALALLGCILYFWYCTKDTGAWMNSNKVPRLLLAELRNNRQHESPWMQKLNYGLVTLLDVDRVTLG